MADAEEVVSNEEMLFVPSLVLVLALSRFTRATQRRKHIKRKHKKKGTIYFSCACVYACAYAFVVPVYTLVSCACACVVRVNQL